jgi:hypothetical protein
MELLLERGAKRDLSDAGYKTALSHALDEGHSRIGFTGPALKTDKSFALTDTSEDHRRLLM